jgi:hypothetical protein
MRRLLQAALLTLVLVLVPTTASAAVVQNVRVPLDVTFVGNPCTGDDMHFTGTIHLLAAETLDGSGGIHIHFDNNVSGVTAVGTPSGTVYHGVGGGWFELNARNPYPNVATETDVFGLISAGSSPNFFAIATFHITVNANGTLTSDVARVSIGCK